MFGNHSVPMPLPRHMNLARRFNAGEAVGKALRRASDG